MLSFSITAFVFEIFFVALLFPLAWARPDLGLSSGRRLGLKVTALGKPWMAAPFCGFVAFAGSAAYSLLVRFPVPKWHDEFSYLLAGDTFASGRLTNPTPPFWEHFETFHVLQVPSYASKYPPGQGLLLAVGEVLGGHPIVGVWLGAGIACGLICWMLQAWVPYRWALLGGLLAALCLGFSSTWSQSYWGGSLAAAGGALLLGGLRRMTPATRPSHGIAIGLGLVILAITRPFEGILFSLPPTLLFVAWILRFSPGPHPRSVLRTCIVIAAVMIPFAFAFAQYNKSVTGDYGRLPYVEYEEQYGAIPVFLWAKVKQLPTYANQVFERYELEAALSQYQSGRTLSGFLSQKAIRTFLSLFEFIHLALLIPILLLFFSGRTAWDRVALLSSGMVMIGSLGNTWSGSRMLAPMAGCLFLFAVQGLRRLRLWRPGGRTVGRGLARGLVIATVLATMIGVAPVETTSLASMPRDRENILHQLENTGERHLVFVRYSQEHNPQEEWVYNRADLEGAPVIWARERTARENSRLIDFFDERRVWLLEADLSPRELFRYNPLAEG